MKKKKKLQGHETPIGRAIDVLVRKHGGINAEIAKILSKETARKISPQRIGQYRRSEKTPGSEFIVLWEEVFGDRILELSRQFETKVSPEPVRNEAKTPRSWDEERGILIDSLKQYNETNAYLLKRIKEMGG